MDWVVAIKSLMRPFITVSLTLTFIYLAIEKVIEPRETVTLVALVVGFYFGDRSARKAENPDIAPTTDGG